MKYYEREIIKDQIDRILRGELAHHSNIEGEIPIADSLFELVNTVSNTCWNMGRLEVQEEIIKIFRNLSSGLHE